MKRQILFSILLSSFTSFSYAESKPSKGAEGIIRSEITNRCFKPKSKYVQQICADYEIRYKLSSLMGEPVGNYVLNWKLSPMSAITIKGIPYNSANIPEPLQKSVAGLELYIDGSANVTIPKKYGTTAHFHRFNTGVAVKAGKGASYNTPGSPNWNKTFIASKACSKTDVKYATVADAKDAFINGFTLSRLEVCSGTEVYGVTYIDDAIEQLCRSEEGAKYKFCPKKEKKQEDKKQSNPIVKEEILLTVRNDSGMLKRSRYSQSEIDKLKNNPTLMEAGRGQRCGWIKESFNKIKDMDIDEANSQYGWKEDYSFKSQDKWSNFEKRYSRVSDCTCEVYERKDINGNYRDYADDSCKISVYFKRLN